MNIFKRNDIIYATQKNNIELVKKLIKNSNIDFKDKNHKSAIFYAVENDNLEILDLLIDNGANVYIKDDRGLTIFHYAILYENSNLIDFLINRKKLNFDVEKVREEVKDIEINDDRFFLKLIKKIF